MNDVTLEHRAAKVSLVNFVSTVLSVGFQLVSVPVCLRYWGMETYGGWIALLSAYQLLRALDAGYGAFVGNKINFLYHRNREELRNHLGSALFGVGAISVLQISLTAGALVFRPLSALFGISTDLAGAIDAKLGLCVLMISWVLSGSYLGVVSRLMIPAGLMYQSAWWAMGFPVGQFAAIMGSALLGLNLVDTSVACAMAQVLVSFATARYVRRALPDFYPWLQGGTIRTAYRDLAQSMFLTASNIIQQSSVSGAVLLVSLRAGPTAVSVFTTVRTLTFLWNSLTAILSAPLLPEVVRIRARGEWAKLLAINHAYWFLAGSAVNMGAIVSYPLIPVIYGRWTTHAIPLDQSLTCFMMASVVVANASALMALHLNGMNRLHAVLQASFVRAALGLGGGVLGFPRFGLASFGIGILAGEIAASLITARHFFYLELGEARSLVRLRSFGPVLLSTASALGFFVGAGFQWWSVGYAWASSVAGVAVASIWGWRRLEPDLQIRLKAIPTKILGLGSA